MKLTQLWLMCVLAVWLCGGASAMDQSRGVAANSSRGQANPITQFIAATSPLRSLLSVEEVINSITVEYIDSVVLRDLSNPETYHVLQDELLVGAYANSSENNIRYIMTVLDVTESNAQEVLNNYSQSHEMNIVQGIIPSSVESTNGYLVIDPIYPNNRLRQANPDFIYFFPTLEQQFYVYAEFFGGFLSMGLRTINVVISSDSTSENEAVLSSLTHIMASFGVPFVSSLTTESAMNFLQPESINLVVGLRNASLLEQFLVNNPNALVILTFDDLTIQYKTIKESVKITDFSIVERIMFATNLPLWEEINPDNEVAMSVYFENFNYSTRGPGTLRSYFTMLMLDELGIRSRTTEAIQTAIYRSSKVAVGTLDLGTLTDICPYPTTEPLSCLVNFGAKNIYIWTYAALFTINRQPFGGPFSPPTSFFTESEDLRTLASEPECKVVGAMVGVMLAMTVVLGVLVCVCLSGYLDEKQSVMTVVHVSVDYTNNGNVVSTQRIQEALQKYALVVEALVKKHKVVQIECSSRSFTLAAPTAQGALVMAKDLIFTVKQLKPLLPIGTTVGLRIGIHTGSCNCARAIDESNADALAVAAAPLMTLAQCVGELCGPNEVLITGWTHSELGENPLSSSCRPHSRNYLDDETTVIEVYRYGIFEGEHEQRAEMSLLTMDSTDGNSKRLSTIVRSLAEDPRMMESTNRSDRINTLGMILIADPSTDEMSSRLINYEI